MTFITFKISVLLSLILYDECKPEVPAKFLVEIDKLIL